MLHFLRLAFRLLAAPECFGDQRVGEDELGLGHVLNCEQSLGGFAGRGIVTANARERGFNSQTFHAYQHAAEAPPAFDRDRHFHLELVAGIALEIRAPHQRTVHAGRGYFQPIGPIDRIRHVQHRRKRSRDRFAVFDCHGPVRPFRHDLDRAAVEPGNPHPD